ncbi:MAG: ATPase subunit of ABC transporter with duplicated ATPase domains [Candidatus Midichloriaceae bacterium]|jgi:ATPase subunit of ABC transporter with duplicated ATPase domains
MILCEDISMYYGGKKLFNDVNLILNENNKYGLIGANGSGKSTLIKLISKEEELSSGKITIDPKLKISSLKQDQFRYENDRIIDVVIQGNSLLWDAMQEQKALSEKEDITNEEGYRIAELESVIYENDGYQAESNAEIILHGLGIEEKDFAEPLKKLSGGYKIRILLAKCLFSTPDILLLDEPTNHLDILSTQWLENFLKRKFKGILVLISHDHDFLNSTCNNILDVDYNTITLYKGNYDRFAKEKQSTLEQKEKEKTSIERKIAKDRVFVDKFRASATRSKQALSREKRIQKIDVPEIRRTTRVAPRFMFRQEKKSGQSILEILDLSQSFKENELFQNLSFNVHAGEKIAILGVNGIGKSTLLKTALGFIDPVSGEAKWGYNTDLAYFSQDHHDLIKGNMSAVNWLMDITQESDVGVVRNALGRMLFTKDEAEKSVDVLSGGESARLLFAKIMLEKANVLIFDEPTNHLDLESRIALANELKAFEGTIIFVSHDRHFISTIAKRIIFLCKGSAIDFSGGYNEFRKKYAKFFDEDTKK